jgi:hypothetical protein
VKTIHLAKRQAKTLAAFLSRRPKFERSRAPVVAGRPGGITPVREDEIEIETATSAIKHNDNKRLPFVSAFD